MTSPLSRNSPVRAPAWAYAVIVSSFVLSALPFLDRPSDGWEWIITATARSVVGDGYPTLSILSDEPASRPVLYLSHPPVWSYLAAAGVRIFGDRPGAVRFPGLLVALLTGYLLILIQREVRREEDRPIGPYAPLVLLAAYLSNPMVLQGALYQGPSDTTLLPLFFVAFALAWMRCAREGIRWSPLLLGSILAGALWSKLTTTLCLPMALGLVLLFRRDPSSGTEPSGKSRSVLSRLGTASGVTAAVAVVGLSVALLGWLIYTQFVHGKTGIGFGEIFMTPFRYFWTESRLDASTPLFRMNPADTAMSAARVFVYYGPFVCLLAVAELFLRVRSAFADRGCRPSDFLSAAILIMFLVYNGVFQGGGVGSFPKYQAAVLPFLIIFAVETAGRLPREERDVPWKTLLSVGCLGAAYYGLVVGDYVHTLNHSLRHARIGGRSLGDPLSLFGMRMFLYSAFPCLALSLWKFRRVSLPMVLMTCLVSSQAGLTAAQFAGKYFLYHSYGTPIRDHEAALGLVKKNTLPADRVLSLPEFAYEAGRRLVPGWSFRLCDDPDALAGLTRRYSPSAVVYSTGLHTVHQINHVYRRSALEDVLTERYERNDVGDYTVWLRKKDLHGR